MASLRADEIWKWVQMEKYKKMGSPAKPATLDNPLYDFGTDHLAALSFEAGNPICFVDWYNVSLDGETEKPFMVSWRTGGTIRIFEFEEEVNLMDLRAYRQLFLSALNRQEANFDEEGPAYWLQKFQGLLKPVFEISEPGDVLVLSPWDPLHGIPLHAIAFNGQPLIRRNPVVYTSSMKSLFNAALARETDASKGEFKHFPPSVFGNATSAQGRNSVQRVANMFGVEPNSGAHFTKEAFMVKDTSLIHYHSHASAQDQELFEQALEFQDGFLSAKEIVEIAPKSQSYHATILSCTSRRTFKTTNNEPFSLVRALMYNGTSSVLSTIWPIDEHDAALFTNEFYSHFPQRVSFNGLDADQEAAPAHTLSCGRMVNLALATQRAILGLLDDGDGRRPLKEWASFILNGWWMLRWRWPGLERFPIMLSARPWPPPPPAPPVRIRSWWLMVPRWFSFYTLWPYFCW